MKKIINRTNKYNTLFQMLQNRHYLKPLLVQVKWGGSGKELIIIKLPGYNRTARLIFFFGSRQVLSDLGLDFRVTKFGRKKIN